MTMRPPRDETPEQREIRLLAEKEAKRISDEIDTQLKLEKKAAAIERRSHKQPVRVLLLGESY